MKFLKLLKEGETLLQVDYDVLCYDGEKITLVKGEIPQPKNVVTYYATEKLTETTSDKNSGLHTNKFGATMVLHEFADGKGTITFDGDVTQFGSYAFYGCTSLTSITIPDSVTSIGTNTFYNCSSLTSVTIGNSVTSIGGQAFVNCSSLTSVTYKGIAYTSKSALITALRNEVVTVYSTAFNNTALTA